MPLCVENASRDARAEGSATAGGGRVPTFRYGRDVFVCLSRQIRRDALLGTASTRRPRLAARDCSRGGGIIGRALTSLVRSACTSADFLPAAREAVFGMAGRDFIVGSGEAVNSARVLAARVCAFIGVAVKEPPLGCPTIRGRAILCRLFSIRLAVRANVFRRAASSREDIF